MIRLWIVIERVFVAVWTGLPESVTVKFTLLVPPSVGLPVI